MVHMSSANRAYRTRNDLPPEIYIPLVDSLFTEIRTLFLGSVAVSLAVLLSAWKTHDAVIGGLWVLLVVIAVVRAFDMRKYARIKPTIKTAAQAARWEWRYVIGAAAFMGLLGVWCLIVFFRTEDAFVRLVSIAGTVAYMIGISGRNFGSARLVAVLILVDGVPVTLSLLVPLELHYAFAAVLLGGFFISFKFISDRLRKTLLDAVVSARDVALLAKRFDTALNNMPSGLCMFNSEQRVVVINNRLIELLDLPAIDRKGETARDLVRDCVAAGTILRSESDRFATNLDRRLTGADKSGFNIHKQDGRTLSLAFQPMENGGSVALVEDITERREAEARIRHLARYDSLTGLPNRMHLRERMEATLATAGSKPSAILFVDLDQFKQVNDTLGHPRGDLLLRAVADRLKRLVRESDIVARFGGDEFVIVQTPTAGPEEAATLARRIVAALSETYEIDGHQVVIGATIGIAMAPRDATGADHLLKNADMALYWSKAEQRGTWRFFEPGMDVRAQERRSLELDLRNALANGSFEIYYQPLFDLKTMKVTTCEALLRWRHPLRGMIPPSEFIPVAEEMGLIVEIGNWVLHQACRACVTWPGDVRVAVNLSAYQFRRGNVTGIVREVLAASGLDPSRLEIEITESVLLQDTRATRLILRQLRELGVRLSLDDFGTGYSSLSYLHGLPLNKVKIDRLFVEGLEAGSRALILLRGVARLSAELGLTVTVEGIETEGQLAIVAAEECINEVQGFLFSVPIPGPQLMDLLNASIVGADRDEAPALQRNAG